MKALSAAVIAVSTLLMAVSSVAQVKAPGAQHETKLGKLARLNDSGRFLFADGVWRSDNPSEKAEKLDSVSHLECYKSGGQEIVGSDAYCMEATAMITFGQIPNVQVTYYGIASWDTDKVIASNSPSDPFPICIWTQITINLRDKSIMATDNRKLGKGHEGLNNVCEKIPLAQTYHLFDTADELVRRSVEASSGKDKNK